MFYVAFYRRKFWLISSLTTTHIAVNYGEIIIEKYGKSLKHFGYQPKHPSSKQTLKPLKFNKRIHFDLIRKENE